ncbi:hypothetical protein BDY19DRAFT_982559 [Irpex rosettiformis]|uniref:Uncharacterized protein n=1 Tax=Irpex rosettiformis TaxID=378272 RepID=A0ACB8UIN0_9APHY|nr:hypothetical protein BDY19DRAFT_982559 [Irpex rosettiformis]
MSAAQKDAQEQSQNASTLQVAVARTVTRSLALYFSRPVRLFRPSKVNGWQTLRALANHHGNSLSPQYISGLVKQQGISVLAKHFVPPMAVNILLGSVLWTTYAETSGVLEQYLNNPIAIAAVSGAAAGGAQALVAAPAENVRLLLEGGSPTTGWSHAWQEVFRGTNADPTATRREQLHEARQVRDWMREVGDMAGRGWDGWKWGVAKDTFGFAIFFAQFELTRRLASKVKNAARETLARRDRSRHVQSHTPRIVSAITLVTGGAVAGLLYEISCRPWDNARKAVHVDHVVALSQQHSVTSILLEKANRDGWTSFFKAPGEHVHENYSSTLRRRIHTLLRTVARVGPWGVGFLAWEAFGPGLS